jgi:pimeloyl-ACP methyl ester carboxylesterase
MKLTVWVMAALLVTSSMAQVGHQCSSAIFLNLVKPLGYPVEEHKVTTEDGYVLTVFRLQAKGSGIAGGKPVVLLQHGNEDSSDGYVLNDEDKAPGFVLANAGYDVWLPNNRGNKYSMTHKTMSVFNRNFWDYSFQEMGAKDQPAIIDYILKLTGKNKLVYVGHSQGNTQMFAGLSDPDSTNYLNSKISKFIALAPVVFATQCYNKALKSFADNPLILQTFDLWGVWDVFPAPCSLNSMQGEFMSYFCTIANDVCKQFLAGSDLDPHYDNTAKLNVFFKHTPNGASVRVFKHFAQMFGEPKSQPRLRKFDFGLYENRRRYQQDKPPAYDFANIRIPVALFTGLQDTLGDPADNLLLAASLRSAGVRISEHRYNEWGHMTFVWGLKLQTYFTDLLAEIAEVAHN